MKRWIYDEFRQTGTDYSDVSEVEKYDEKMSRLRDFKGEAENIKMMLGLDSGMDVVEFGSGTGRVSLEISRWCRHVTAMDVSPAMVNYSSSRAKQSGIKNIEFLNSGFLTFSSEKKFDRAVSQLALHHLPDFWKMAALKKIRSSLRENGKFYLMDVVFSFPEEEYDAVISSWIEKIRKLSGDSAAAEVERHIKDEYSTFDWIMEEMLYRSGFYIEDADYDDMLAVYTCSCSTLND